MHGFFTYYYDPESRELLIPKMCGDGKYWRRLIYKMAKAARGITRGVYCCTKRNPAAYMRVLGGTLAKMEHVYDFRTGKRRTLWYIFITFKDTKESDDKDDTPIISFDIDLPLPEDFTCEGRELKYGCDDSPEERGTPGA
jgi:hypothetical protein